MAVTKWDPIRLFTGEANSLLIAGSEQLSKVGDIFTKLREHLLAERKLEADNAYKEAALKEDIINHQLNEQLARDKLSEEMYQYDTSFDEKKRQFDETKKQDTAKTYATALAHLLDAGGRSVKKSSNSSTSSSKGIGEGSSIEDWLSTVNRGTEESDSSVVSNGPGILQMQAADIIRRTLGLPDELSPIEMLKLYKQEVTSPKPVAESSGSTSEVKPVVSQEPTTQKTTPKNETNKYLIGFEESIEKATERVIANPPDDIKSDSDKLKKWQEEKTTEVKKQAATNIWLAKNGQLPVKINGKTIRFGTIDGVTLRPVVQTPTTEYASLSKLVTNRAQTALDNALKDLSTLLPSMQELKVQDLTSENGQKLVSRIIDFVKNSNAMKDPETEKKLNETLEVIRTNLESKDPKKFNQAKSLLMHAWAKARYDVELSPKDAMSTLSFASAVKSAIANDPTKQLVEGSVGGTSVYHKIPINPTSLKFSDEILASIDREKTAVNDTLKANRELAKEIRTFGTDDTKLEDRMKRAVGKYESSLSNPDFRASRNVTDWIVKEVLGLDYNDSKHVKAINEVLTAWEDTLKEPGAWKILHGSGNFAGPNTDPNRIAKGIIKKLLVKGTYVKQARSTNEKALRIAYLLTKQENNRYGKEVFYKWITSSTDTERPDNNPNDISTWGNADLLKGLRDKLAKEGYHDSVLDDWK